VGGGDEKEGWGLGVEGGESRFRRGGRWVACFVSLCLHERFVIIARACMRVHLTNPHNPNPNSFSSLLNPLFAKCSSSPDIPPPSHSQQHHQSHLAIPSPPPLPLPPQIHISSPPNPSLTIQPASTPRHNRQSPSPILSALYPSTHVVY